MSAPIQGVQAASGAVAADSTAASGQQQQAAAVATASAIPAMTSEDKPARFLRLLPRRPVSIDALQTQLGATVSLGTGQAHHSVWLGVRGSSTLMLCL
jgi:hypothetical protein